MDRNSIDWHGPLVALITPFKKSGEIDKDSFCQNIDRMIKKGATGVLVAGCTGEFWALSYKEKKLLFELSVETVNGRGTVICNCSAITPEETIELTKESKNCGSDGSLILPSYFIKLTENEIINYYKNISSATSSPIIIYNIPNNAVNDITPELALELCKINNIVAIKESSGNWKNFYSTLILAKSKIRIFCGPSSVYGFPATMADADGTIDCFPNVWAPGCMDIFYKSKDGDHVEAMKLQEIGNNLTELFTSGGKTLYPSTKAAMNILGFNGGYTRPPLNDLNKILIKDLEKGLKQIF
jgi:4-hydroxy-tetrahydrodipicolinate synthase